MKMLTFVSIAASILLGLLLALPSVQGRLNEPARLLGSGIFKKKHNFTANGSSAHPQRYYTDWMEIRDNALVQAAAATHNRELQVACTRPPRYKAWSDVVLGRLQDLPRLLDLHDAYGVLDWPFWYTWLIDMDDSDEVFGNNGPKQGHEFQLRFQQLQGFWDIKSNDILLKALKGSIIADTEKMV
jgi:hypothetical protein